MNRIQVREEGTGMPDEVNFETHLLSVDDALKKLFPDEARVVAYAWMLYEYVSRVLPPEYAWLESTVRANSIHSRPADTQTGGGGASPRGEQRLRIFVGLVRAPHQHIVSCPPCRRRVTRPYRFSPVERARLHSPVILDPAPALVYK